MFLVIKPRSDALPRIASPYMYGAAAALIGSISWSGDMTGLFAAPLLIYLWGKTASRFEAFILTFCYYLAAGHGLIAGAGVFFGDTPFLPSPLPGLLLCIGYSAILAATWGGLWGPDRKSIRILLILVVISIPPVGIVGGYNPVLATGAYFPGLRWIGLTLTLMWMCLLVQRKWALASTLPVLTVSIAANLIYVEPTIPGWTARNTSLGPAVESAAQFSRMKHLQHLVSTWSNSSRDGAVLILPELVGDDWSTNAPWWERIDAKLKTRGQTVFLGSYIPQGNGTTYENVIVAMGNGAGALLRDRVPVPISMWKPWANNGALSFWAETGVKPVAGKRVASLVCYEQLLMWPVILSLLDSPDVLIAPANDWWATDTNLPDLQRQSVHAWSRAFSLPSFWSTNR